MPPKKKGAAKKSHPGVAKKAIEKKETTAASTSAKSSGGEGKIVIERWYFPLLVPPSFPPILQQTNAFDGLLGQQQLRCVQDSGGASINSIFYPANLEKALKEAGHSVTINPEKPRKGCFEVRSGDNKVLLLLIQHFGPVFYLVAHGPLQFWRTASDLV
eukprot:261756-Rhodomonas_salina.4